MLETCRFLELFNVCYSSNIIHFVISIRQCKLANWYSPGLTGGQTVATTYDGPFRRPLDGGVKSLLSVCSLVCVCVCVCLTQTCSQTAFQTISTNGTGSLPTVSSVASARAHTVKLSHSEGSVVGTGNQIYIWEYPWAWAHLSLLLFCFLCLSVPYCLCLLHYFSSTISLSPCSDVTLIWHYSRPPSCPPSLVAHPSSPSLCHPFYCKPCDWQLQLKVLQRALTSAVWLCKDPTLPPASTPTRPRGLPLATGFKSGQKKTPQSFGGAATLHSLCK